jgi:hypothetical protein
MDKPNMNKMEDNAPRLEDFGLDSSIYSNFENRKNELYDYFKSKIEFIQDTEKEYEKIVEFTENNWFINVLLFVLCVGSILACYYLVYIFGFMAWLDAELSDWIAIPIALIIGYGPLFVPGFIEEKFKISDFVRNLFTGGKYTIAEDEIQKTRYRTIEIEKVREQTIEKLKNETKIKVAPFEESFCNYYQHQLDEFYTKKLYKKRSGTKEFEHALSEFESMIGTISEANNVLITKRIHLSDYNNYLEGRKLSHNIQTEKIQNKNFEYVGDFIKKASQSKVEKRVGPEEKYRTPKKIDWESRNKNMMKTGREGEELVFDIEKDYLVSIGKNDLADKVRHVSFEDGDGSGYDILSFFPDGREKYIEVKSTTKSLNKPFYISSNEIGFLKEHPNDSFVYIILVSYQDEEDFLRTYSGTEFFQSGELTPIQYVVKMN